MSSRAASSSSAAAAVDARLGCSTISFRARPLTEALELISTLGFAEIDLGALPGVCDHVPYELDETAVARVAGDVSRSGLQTRSVNGDVGDLNADLDDAGEQTRAIHLRRLLDLTARIGATALVLPCGAQDHTPLHPSVEQDLDLVAGRLNDAASVAATFGVQVWTESLHHFRLCHDTKKAALLHDRLSPAVGIVMDFSHVTASGASAAAFAAANAERIRHVHLRDARDGDIHVSIGRGEADFDGGLRALAAHGYTGHYSLELETRDVTDEQRPAAVAAAARFVEPLLG